MGQAFDRDGNVLGEAFGETKREVFDKLMKEHVDAHEIRIRTLEAAAAEMPRYKCHKEVWALKIRGIDRDAVRAMAEGRETDNSALLIVEPPYAPIRVDVTYLRKHDPQVGGYYVVYTDGYASFSPAKAFEDGYTLVPAPEAP